MSVLQAHLSFENLGHAQSSLLNCAGGCRLERKSRSATAVILSSWKWRIRLELSHYDRRLFDLSASCQELVAARLPFRSQFPKVASGLYELSGRKIDLCLECTGVT